MGNANNDIGVPAKAAAAWLLAALAVRAMFAALTPNVIDSADSILYLETADALARGAIHDAYPRIPWLYPAFAAAASFVFRNIELAAVAVSFLAGSLLIVPVYLLSRRMHGVRAANYAALLIALWPWYVDYSTRVAPEMLYCLSVFGSAALLSATLRHGGLYKPGLAAALVGIYLSRPEGLITAAALILSGFLLYRRSKQTLWRLVGVAAAFCAVVVLHLIVMRAIAERAGVPPRLTPDSLAHALIERGADSLRAGATLLVYTLPVMLGPLLIGLAAIGTLVQRGQPRERSLERTLLVVAGAQWLSAALSTFAEPRYIMVTVLVAGLWAARGAAVLHEMLAMSPRFQLLRPVPAASIVTLMTAGLTMNVLPPMLGRMSYKPLEYKIAGQWMREHLDPGIVFSRKPQVGYYARMRTTGPAPDDTLDVVRQRMIDAGARYLVVDERYSTEMIPALRPLLEPANAPAWLRVIRADLSPYPQARLVIYELADVETR